MINPLVALVLVSFGYLGGRIDLGLHIRMFALEVYSLPMPHKGYVVAGLLVLAGLYLLLLLPLLAIATHERGESQKNDASNPTPIVPTSFRSELRRRGSYSMNYINDIKSHVMART
ncbi:hypothetical protein SPRG_07956 [Saprolegnia parasitica CBS 223.65]|uniref:Uncharacterized protein n=1 Tax=Saprolegnia parasitica (strain CBS 223.65) TaxID=695850 RepID=A0A067C702_SAPPC|nr:hypothetical protein SPRG_07956 [Saprolegnia parasitica CBS 223.65]KDO26554.1 hypothetical protein SPRG_07956 [Saprolegnia parasitica CBS 223.65]|eukprot:XP_012202697.1 hypothetical protein SPRG_07956 [Saprolegnia parasitica CBS 223.65]